MTHPENAAPPAPKSAAETQSGKTPNAPEAHRRPGEAVFAVLVALASLGLLYSAYGISGFEALSAPGSVPMATTAVMSIATIAVLIQTLRRPARDAGSFFRVILPPNVIIAVVLLVLYALALNPLGFLPTSAVFLILSIKILGRRTWGFSALVGLLSLIAIYLIFRIVFTVLMPAGIVPEGEMLAWLRGLFGKGV
ncbi:MAG: tripartite tricarboxylate transporter TctB family protein [Paracoccaceae bacterium]